MELPAKFPYFSLYEAKSLDLEQVGVIIGKISVNIIINHLVNMDSGPLLTRYDLTLPEVC